MSKSVAIVGTRGYPSYYGGFETLVRELSPYLVERGWNVTVYSRKGAVEVDDPHRDPRVETVVTRGVESKSLSTLTYGLTSAAHAARKRPDVALVMNVANGFWLPILKARGIPTIVNVDGIEWERAKWGRAAKTVFKRGAQLTARFGDQLIYDSHEIGRRWSKEFKRDGNFIPYGGTIPPQLDPVEGLAPRSYVLMVSRFVPENTVEEFFSAAEALSRDWDVVIVGSSGYGGELDQRAQDLAEGSARIHWLGHVSDDEKLFSLWQNAGAYFHGHSVGGTNPALIQAMACGAPIVARNTVYNREVLSDAAQFVEPQSDAIAKAVDEVLSDRRLQMELSAGAIERQGDQYTWEGVCDLYEQLLVSACAGTAESTRSR
ncbi:glycosyltransferase [Rhodococcus opacus]|uniref:Glycosyltransferase n=1 Tax=Rhodococcus opacus TaxID=37919 RepID=A0AAX3YIM1_RHOOP|nr:glycosyltransferase [Rhodococcus opacus]ELB94529.1 glycosyltransferase [Rhodococcus wratislaviensis IFP 2016]NHU45681.1 glycosyltransferase family 1 protein [Rhodococcus sp. A14]MCZ4585305.1 glycosyltransferase [Rhodococcus opacus]MDX5962931.1 glycosyltransferase [Rhodococcus opacus]NKY69854.1 glycosyltransferase family 1 protein [Rhodococcus opacus]